MTLLREIQGDIVNPAIKLSATLRKSKILARRLKHTDLEQWIGRELSGYDGVKDELLPPYRKAVTQSLGQFTDGFGVADNVSVRIPKEAEEPYKWASTIYFREGVSELEALIESGRGMFEQPWPQALVATIPATRGTRCIRAWKVATSAQFQFVLDSIRTGLLNFVLELEEINPNAGEGVAFESIPPERLQQVFFTNIYGGNNVMASGNSVQQKVVQNVASAKPDEIAKAFTILMEKANSLPEGVDKTDAQNAVKALESEARKGKEAQEKSVRKWLSFLLETAPDIGQVAIDTLANPVKGLSTVFRKVADKAKAERESKKPSS